MIIQGAPGSGINFMIDLFTDTAFGDYLYTDWSEQKYNQYMLARTLVPGYSNVADYKIGMKRNENYMQQHGLGWEDVVNAWNLPGYNQQSGAVGNTLNWVSSNISKLYRDKYDRDSRW